MVLCVVAMSRVCCATNKPCAEMQWSGRIGRSRRDKKKRGKEMGGQVFGLVGP